MTVKVRAFVSALFLFAWALVLSDCGPNTSRSPPPAGFSDRTPLPPPGTKGSMSLEETLVLRRSVREFDAEPLVEAELGQLLWAAQGITNARGFRTAPSAGALYPLELYLTTADGVFHYDPVRHGLDVLDSRDVRQQLFEAALQQEPVRQAPAVVIVAAVYERTASKYGEERTPRYVHLEAGHSAQNLLLEAVALHLGAVTIGAFHDEQVQEVLGLPADQQPLYLIPVGHPAQPSP